MTECPAPGAPPSTTPAERAAAEQAEEACLDEAVGEREPGLVVELPPGEPADQAFDRLLESGGHLDGAGPFEAERCHRDLPALVERAE